MSRDQDKKRSQIEIRQKRRQECGAKKRINQRKKAGKWKIKKRVKWLQDKAAEVDHRGGGCVCFDQYRIKNIIVEEGKSEIYVASQKVYKKRLYQKEN